MNDEYPQKAIQQDAPETPTPELATPPPRHRTKGPSVALTLMIIVGLAASMGIVVLSTRKPQEIRSRATNNGPKLSIEPSTKNAKIGDTFTLGITINTQDDTVSAAELHLTYDKSAIQVTGFTPGTALPVVLKPATFTDGTISVTLGSQPTSPFKGAGIVGTVTAKILTAKQSTLAFTGGTAVAATGKTTNALAEKIDGTIIGSSAGGNSSAIPPTPTHTPSPTQSTTIPPVQNSFGGLTENQTTTTQPPINITNYVQQTQNTPILPQQYTPPVTQTPEPPEPRSNNIIATIFIALANFFQTIMSGTAK